MNKYTLTFFDSTIEDQYQQYSQSSYRRKSFNLVTACFLFAYVLRVASCFTSGDYTLFYFKLSCLIWTIVQYFFVKHYEKYTRLAFIILNIINMIINVEQIDGSSLEMQNIKGANTMAISFMILLSGDYPESVVTFIILTLYKIIVVAINKSEIYISTLSTSILLIFASSFYFYYINKARRSQYLLTLVEKCWDKILFQLIKCPFIVLEFHYHSFKYEIERVKNFPFFKQQTQNQVLSNEQRISVESFLTESKYCGLPLKTFIFEQIKIFQKDYKDQFCQDIYVIYHKHYLHINLSIFSASNPTILLQFKNLKRIEKNSQILIYQNRYIKFMKFLIQFLKKLDNMYINSTFKNMQTQLYLILLLDELRRKKYYIQSLSICKLKKILQQLFPYKEIEIQSFNDHQQILTTFNVFISLLIIIIKNIQTLKITIIIDYIQQQNQIQIEIEGQFNLNKLKQIFKIFHFQIYLIIENYNISYKKLSFLLHKEPLSCFTTEIMNNIK